MRVYYDKGAHKTFLGGADNAWKMTDQITGLENDILAKSHRGRVNLGHL